MFCVAQMDSTVYCGSTYSDWDPRLTKMANKADQSAEISIAIYPVFIQGGKLTVDKTYGPEYATTEKVDNFERFITVNFADLTNVKMVLAQNFTVCAVSDFSFRCRATWADEGTTSENFEKPIFQNRIVSAYLFDQGFCAKDSRNQLKCWRRYNHLSELIELPLGTVTLKSNSRLVIDEYYRKICVGNQSTNQLKCEDLYQFFSKRGDKSEH